MRSPSRYHPIAAALAAAAVCLSVPLPDARAAGFFLPYQGAAAIGNSLAGSAALGEDASTVFFNPAGMARLEGGQVAVVGHYVQPDFNFTDGGTSGTVPMFRTGSNGGDFAPGTALPNLFTVVPAGNWRFGLGISAIWGSKTDYEPNWIGRFHAALTDLKSANLNPSASYRLNPQWSVGGGLNYMILEAEIQRAQILAPTVAGVAKFDGKDHGYGYNLGVLWEPTQDTRVGLSFRSKINFSLEGSQSVYAASGATLSTTNITADLTLPSITQLSVVHALNDRVTLLGDLSYYQWSAIQSLDVYNRATGALSTSLALKYRDTRRISAAVNYRLSDAWLLRGGLAWDQAPVGNAEDRTANQPDADRTWVSLGARWDLGKHHRLDMAYAHVFFASNPINHTVATSSTTSQTLRGNYDNSADIVSVQYTFGW